MHYSTAHIYSIRRDLTFVILVYHHILQHEFISIKELVFSIDIRDDGSTHLFYYVKLSPFHYYNIKYTHTLGIALLL